MKKLFALSLGLGVAIVAAGHAQAQRAACAERAEIVERLETRYGERRINVGLGDNNAGIVEVFASAETGTWTILVTLPSGTSCLVATGQSWEAVADGPGKPGEGA